MSDKLNIHNEMAQLDQKNRGFYDELTDEERKKFSSFLMLRWGSAVDNSNIDLLKYYIISTNQQANKHFFSLGKHPKLQWLLSTTISPDMGKFKHEWIAFKGKKTRNKRAALIEKLYPELKTDEAELLANTISDAEIKTLLLDLAWTDKDIKEAMK